MGFAAPPKRAPQQRPSNPIRQGARSDGAVFHKPRRKTTPPAATPARASWRIGVRIYSSADCRGSVRP